MNVWVPAVGDRVVIWLPEVVPWEALATITEVVDLPALAGPVVSALADGGQFPDDRAREYHGIPAAWCRPADPR